MLGRVIAISLGIVVLLLVVGGFALNSWLQGWLKGPEFRGLVEAQTGKALGGKAAFSPFVWSGPSVFSPDLDLQGNPGKPVETLRAQQIRADVNWRAAFSGAWHVRRIDVTRLDISIPPAKPASPAAEATADVHAIEQVARAESSLPSWLPSQFNLDEVAVQDANVNLGEAGAIRNSVLTVKPEGAGWIFDANGGKFDPPAVLKQLDIDHIRVRLQQGVVYLTDAHLRSGGAGRITANGEIGGHEKPYDIRITWQNIDAAEVLDDVWENRLSGLINGEIEVVPAAPGAAPVRGKFNLMEGLLHGLPIQEDIARFTRSPQFQRMPIHELSSDFETDGAVTDFTNFILESKGLLRMVGSGRVGPGNAVSGTFQIGVTPQTLQWLPGSQEKVFVESRDGYLWTSIRIGGTLDSPTEDLSNRLARAMGEQVIETGVQILESAPEKTREALDRAIDILSPFLR